MTTCPKCQRRLDRSWSECPYCKREREAALGNEKPEARKEVKGKEEAETPMSDNKDSRGATRVETPRSSRETKYQPADPGKSESRSESSPGPSPQDNRKIVGVLACYTWKPEGELFPVREGRTHIGAGQIKEDTTHRLVDVYCPADTMLSEDHAMILVQQKKFWIRDLDSTNGTKLNGEQLRPDAAEELPNHAEIRVGKTDFTFLKIEQKSSPEESRPEPGVPERESKPPENRHPTILR